MSLRFIMGESGTGKTQTCIDEICSTNGMERRLFYIVPEQFTLESEKAILFKKKALININVLGFNHLAYYLINRFGGDKRVIIDDVAKAMLIKKIALEKKEELSFYKSAVNKQGFIDDLNKTITEMMQYSVSIGDLKKLAKKAKNSGFKDKLEDIVKLYESYKEYMNRDYISSEGALDVLCELIESSEIAGSEVWIDGFKSYTKQELKIIEKLLKCCKRVNITFSIGDMKKIYTKLSPYDEQYEIKKSVNSIGKIARANNIEIEDILKCKKVYTKYSKEMLHLRENYLKFKPLKFEFESENIKLFSGKNIYVEVDYICKSILNLIKEENYSYKEIGVIVGSKEYEKVFSAYFKKYNIPNFLDSRKDINNHPLVIIILSALEAVGYGYNNSAIFRLLKTGYTDIDFEDIFNLENYVIANGINKYKWNMEWKYGFKINENDNKPTKEYILEIKERVLKIFEPILKYNSRKEFNVREITKDLLKVLEYLNVKEKIELDYKRAIENGNLEREIISSQIWEEVILVFEKLVDILGKEKVSIREYISILRTGFSSANIGVAPPLQDYVIVGDIERSRMANIKAIFIAGANESNIPIKIKNSGIFSGDERSVIEESKIEMSPNVIQKINSGKLSLFLSLIRPSEKLFISYASSNFQDMVLVPSIIFDKIKNIFPKVKEFEINDKDFNIKSILSNKNVTFENMLKAIYSGDESEFIAELLNIYRFDKEYLRKIENIKAGALTEVPIKYLEKGLLEMLWSEVFENSSISKLERFMDCPFKFFGDYILKAQKKNTYYIKSNDIGNFIHKILEDFISNVSKKNGFGNIEKQDIESFVDKNYEKYIDILNTDIFELKRNEFIFDKILEIVKNTLWVNVEQIKASNFKPKEFEFSFNKKNCIQIELENNKKMNIRGKIDRIDTLVSEDGTEYIKIIDYKSSEKSLDYDEIYQGLQLQLAVYMKSYIDYVKSSPAAMFYSLTDEPTIEDSEGLNYCSDVSGEDIILNKMAVNGMLLDRLKDSLDTYNINIIKSRKETKTKRDIKIPKSYEVSDSEFKLVLDYSMEKIKEIGNEMIKGNISVSPSKDKSSFSSSCKYCSFSPICNIKNQNVFKKEKENVGKRNWNEKFNEYLNKKNKTI